MIEMFNMKKKWRGLIHAIFVSLNVSIIDMSMCISLGKLSE